MQGVLLLKCFRIHERIIKFEFPVGRSRRDLPGLPGGSLQAGSIALAGPGLPLYGWAGERNGKNQ